MRKLTFIFLPFFVATFTNAQNDFSNQSDCYFFNDTINENNYNKYLDTIGSVELMYSISEESYKKLISCLLKFDSINPKLNFYYAGLSESEHINDTSFFAYYRISIENNFLKGEAYYNMGVFFINNLLRVKENGSLAIFDYPLNEREKYFNLAEKYMYASYNSGFEESIFTIAQFRNLKYEYLELPIPGFELEGDTLTIITKIRDCGEYGGHIERIELISNGAEYDANFNADSVYCMNEAPRLSNIATYNGKSIIISKESLMDLFEAINSYNVDPNVFSNSPVEIAIINNDQVLYQSVQDSRWPAYLEFRKKTFNF